MNIEKLYFVTIIKWLPGYLFECSHYYGIFCFTKISFNSGEIRRWTKSPNESNITKYEIGKPIGLN